MPELETRRQPELAMEHSMCRQVAVKLLAGPSSSAQLYILVFPAGPSGSPLLAVPPDPSALVRRVHLRQAAAPAAALRGSLRCH